MGQSGLPTGSKDGNNIGVILETQNRLLSECKAAERFLTPFYLYHADIIRDRIRQLKRVFSKDNRCRIYYAIKANANPLLLSLIKDEGLYFDACSEGDVYLAQKANIPFDRISFTGVGLGYNQIKRLNQSSSVINFDSLQELQIAAEVTPGTCVGVRVNTGVKAGFHEHCQSGTGSGKLGINVEELSEIHRLEKENKIKVVTLHTHIGSGILETAPFLNSALKLFELAHRFPNLQYINMGGGIGAPCVLNSTPFPLKEYASACLALRDQFENQTGRKITLCIEPGEFIMAESGSLIMKVRATKRREVEGKLVQIIILDGNLNHFLGTTLYAGEFPFETNASGELVHSIVYGNSNQAGDRFSAGRDLPLLKRGDIMVMRNTGAYGFSRSANFNEHTRPMEMLCNNSNFSIIRQAELMEDLDRLVPTEMKWQEQ